MILLFIQQISYLSRHYHPSRQNPPAKEQCGRKQSKRTQVQLVLPSHSTGNNTFGAPLELIVLVQGLFVEACEITAQHTHPSFEGTAITAIPCKISTHGFLVHRGQIATTTTKSVSTLQTLNPHVINSRVLYRHTRLNCFLHNYIDFSSRGD